MSPLAILIPKQTHDIRLIIQWKYSNNIFLLCVCLEKKIIKVSTEKTSRSRSQVLCFFYDLVSFTTFTPLRYSRNLCEKFQGFRSCGFGYALISQSISQSAFFLLSKRSVYENIRYIDFKRPITDWQAFFFLFFSVVEFEIFLLLIKTKLLVCLFIIIVYDLD